MVGNPAGQQRKAPNMLALPAMDDTTEIKSLITFKRVSAFEVLQRAKVDWRVEKRPIYLGTGECIPNHFATVRTDNGRSLGIVGARYQVLQNQSGLDLFDAAAAKGAIEYGNAGTFKGGRIVWLQAKLGSFAIGPDEVAKYLLLATSHDGSSNLRVLYTPTRVACLNTLQAALAAGLDTGLTIRHTRSGEAKVRQAIAAIESAGRFYNAFADAANHLYRRAMPYSAVRSYVENVFPSEGKPSTRLEGVRNRVIDLFENGKGHFAIRGTAWAGYNAVAEYVDHFRSTRGDEANRLESAWLGSGAEIKRRAFELAVAV
jgi:phage/plasmid-like protein (TIGR03299 family)